LHGPVATAPRRIAQQLREPGQRVDLRRFALSERLYPPITRWTLARGLYASRGSEASGRIRWRRTWRSAVCPLWPPPSGAAK
jgi:hypothetical protein